MFANLTRELRTKLIRALVELSDSDSYIPHSVSEISAKLEERIGRPVSDMTVRAYLKDGGFTWLARKAIPKTRGTKIDRVAELARIIEQLMIHIGLHDDDMEERLKRIIKKQGQRVHVTELPDA